MKYLWDSLIEGVRTWVAQLLKVDYPVYIGRLVNVILILIAANIIIRIGRVIIREFFRRQQKHRFSMDERKANTLSTIMQSILRYTVYFCVVLAVLDVLGLKSTTNSLLATAGIGGLAIGIGAQSLVKDVVTGFFILFEGQFAVGDLVAIGDITGTVEEIGLRVTHIRGFKGDLNIIPNGTIDKVTNFSRGNSLAIVDISIDYEADVDKALKVLEKVSMDFSRDNPDIIEPPQVLGIMNLGEYDVNIRVIARTAGLKHWGVERELRKRIKHAFAKEGIEMPYPRRVVITQNEKSS